MTELKLYTLAYQGALEAWERERRYLEELPDNPFTSEREQKAWEVVDEISKKLKELEKKNKEKAR